MRSATSKIIQFTQVPHQPLEVCEGLADAPIQRQMFYFQVAEVLLHVDKEALGTG